MKNDIFVTYERAGTLAKSGTGNVAGWTWDNNLWFDGNTNLPESGARGPNDVNADPLLTRTQGWQTFCPVDGGCGERFPANRELGG